MGYTHDTVARVLIFNPAGEVLLHQRTGTKYLRGFYDVPGGSVENGETTLAAAYREPEEELGIRFAPGELRLAAVVEKRSSKDGSPAFVLETYYVAEGFVGLFANREPERHSESQWFDTAALPEQVYPPLREVVPAVWGGKFAHFVFDEDFKMVKEAA